MCRPRGMVWGGRREEGSGWGTHVYLWRIHFDIWQNQYNFVKFKNKIKLKKKKEMCPEPFCLEGTYSLFFWLLNSFSCSRSQSLEVTPLGSHLPSSLRLFLGCYTIYPNMTVSVPSPHPLHSSVLWFLSVSASLLGHAYLKDDVRSILLTTATLEASTVAYQALN